MRVLITKATLATMVRAVTAVWGPAQAHILWTDPKPRDNVDGYKPPPRNPGFVLLCVALLANHRSRSPPCGSARRERYGGRRRFVRQRGADGPGEDGGAAADGAASIDGLAESGPTARMPSVRASAGPTAALAWVGASPPTGGGGQGGVAGEATSGGGGPGGGASGSGSAGSPGSGGSRMERGPGGCAIGGAASNVSGLAFVVLAIGGAFRRRPNSALIVITIIILGRMMKGTLWIAVFALFLASCATFRLGGCSKLAQCGELGAYSCDDQLVCADARGETIRSEFPTTWRNPCQICRR